VFWLLKLITNILEALSAWCLPLKTTKTPTGGSKVGWVKSLPSLVFEVYFIDKIMYSLCVKKIKRSVRIKICFSLLRTCLKLNKIKII